MLASATIIIASAAVAGSAAVPSDAEILRAIGRPSENERKAIVRRKLTGDFDGDAYPDTVATVEIEKKTGDSHHYDFNCRTTTYFLECVDGVLLTRDSDQRGHWPGVPNDVEEREKRVGAFLEAVDVDGDGIDEVLLRYDESWHTTGWRGIHARIYRWNDRSYEAVWDEKVDVASTGARSQYAFEYRTSATRLRTPGGALHIVLTASETRTDNARVPYYVETRHKVFGWDGSRLALIEDRLVSSHVIDEETRKRMETVP